MKILLVKKSETCAECLLGIYNRRWFCLGTGKDIDLLKSRYEKPSWCPLRPLPQKIEVEVNEFDDIMHTEFSIEDICGKIRLDTDKIFSLGWNACLDEITGDKE